MPSDAGLHFQSAREQGELIRSRQISPVDLVRAYLERIERYDSALRAYEQASPWHTRHPDLERTLAAYLNKPATVGA